MINIKQLYNSPVNTSEDFEIDGDDYYLSGELIRIDEGIKMIIKTFEGKQKANCVRCRKELVIDLKSWESVWIFYGKKPEDYIETEMMLIDRKYFKIDTTDVERQEKILRSTEAPHCKEECMVFDEAQKGKKALANLKGIWEDQLSPNSTP